MATGHAEAAFDLIDPHSVAAQQRSSPTLKEFDSHSHSEDERSRDSYEFDNDGALPFDGTAAHEGQRQHRFNSTKNAQQPPKQFHEDHSPSVGDDLDYGGEHPPHLQL